MPLPIPTYGMAVLAFAFGVILQTLRYVRTRQDFKMLAWCFAFGALALFPSKKEREYSPLEHAIISVCFFAIAAAFVFRQRIIGRLNEQYLLHTNIVYAFFLLTLRDWTAADASILLLALLPSIHTLAIVLYPKPFKSGVDVISFLWFFVMNIVMLLGTVVQFSVRFAAQVDTITYSTLWESLTIGPAAFLLIAYATYIWNVIPLPSKHQTFAERFRHIREFFRELKHAYDPVQLRITHALAILFIEGGLLWIAYQYQLISPILAVNISLILFSFFIPNTEGGKVVH